MFLIFCPPGLYSKYNAIQKHHTVQSIESNHHIFKALLIKWIIINLIIIVAYNGVVVQDHIKLQMAVVLAVVA